MVNLFKQICLQLGPIFLMLALAFMIGFALGL